MTREQETISNLATRLESIAVAAERLARAETPHTLTQAAVFGELCGKLLAEVASAHVAVEAARREFGK